MDTQKYIQIIKVITEAQSEIVGEDIALSLAQQVEGLNIKQETIEIQNDPIKVLEQLVHNYSNLFGNSSLEVCKQAIKDMKPTLLPQDIPAFLK